MFELSIDRIKGGGQSEHDPDQASLTVELKKVIGKSAQVKADEHERGKVYAHARQDRKCLPHFEPPFRLLTLCAMILVKSMRGDDGLNSIATTGRRNQPCSIELARSAAARLNIKFVERGDRSIEELALEYGVDEIIIAKKNTLRLLTIDGRGAVREIFFHPSTAHLRIKALRAGANDRMIEAMGLTEGMRVLDCTLGLGSDSIVASYVSRCEVVSIEINPLMAYVIERGLGTFEDDNRHVVEAMRRVRVLTADHLDILRAEPSKSFDVVYFDPMFRHALEKSSALNVIREAADHRRLSLEAIEEAKRVAQCRVVLKENARSLEFDRLGFNKFAGGRYSPIKYGVFEL